MKTRAQSAERPYAVTTLDGLRLRAWIASPGGARGILLLCHGLASDAEERGAFPALRDLALRSGLAVVRFDFRAHGSSPGSNQHLRLAGLRCDIEAMLGVIDSELPSTLPLIPVGVSFAGGPAVHAATISKRCAGVVLWYAVVDYQHNFGVASTVPFTRQMRAAADRVTGPTWAEMPVLGTDWFFPAAMLDEMPGDHTLARLRDLPAPVLAYHGSRDAFVDVAPLRDLATERPGIDLRIARGAGHGFLLWRPWVIRRTIEWAARAMRASGLRAPQ